MNYILFEISGLSPRAKFRVKTWHHTGEKLVKEFSLQWNDGKAFDIKPFPGGMEWKTKIKQHVQDVKSTEDGELELKLTSDQKDPGTSVVLNALEIKQCNFQQDFPFLEENCLRL